MVTYSQQCFTSHETTENSQIYNTTRWLDPDENAPQFAGADLNSGLCISNMADHKFYPARMNETNS